MILTVTPNPSLDLLFHVDRLVWDDANRIEQPRRRPGGQGINVVRAVRALEPGADALACTFLGGPTGDELRGQLDREGTPYRAVPIDGETRVFVGVREADTGRSLLLNPRGPTIAAEEADALLAAIAEALDGQTHALDGKARPLDGPGDTAGRGAEPSRGPDAGPDHWVIGCGSLPPGMPRDFYATVGRLAHARGVRFVPDCDGPALAEAAPLADLLVPNDMEAARLAGRAVTSVADAVTAGRLLLESGPERVVITLGERGAVAVSSAGAWWARLELPGTLAREVAGGTAVGAGDAFLAGLLLARSEEEPVRLAEAVAAGTAVLLGRGRELVAAADVERVVPHVIVERQDA